MTTVVFTKNSQGKYIGFSCEGHSGYAVTGYDIVCAGISILSQATMHGVQDIVQSRSISNVDNEKASMELLVVGAIDDRSEILIRTMAEMILMLMEQYPEYVRAMVIQLQDKGEEKKWLQ